MTSIHKIKPIYLAVIMLSFALVMIGCSKDLPTADDVDTKSVNFILNLSRYGEADADNRIESLRLIIFDEDNKAMIKNIVFTPADVYQSAAQKYVLSVNLKGFRAVRYFVIANEPAAWNLGNGISYANLKALEADYYNSANDVLDVKAPFLMLAQCDEAVETPAGSSITKELSLVRNVVKVTLKLKQTLAIPGSNIALHTLKKIFIDRIPKNGFLFPDKTYDAALTYTKTPQTNLTAADFEISDDYSTLKNDLVLYIPEHLLTDKDNYTCIRILGTEIGSGADVNYEIVLGDGADKLYRTNNPVALADLTTSDLSITRNTHFIIDATISPKTMLVTFELAPWKDGGTIDVDEGEIYYLNLSDAFVTYPHKLFFDKNKIAWIKDADGKYIKPVGLDYYCYFWTNRASSTVKITDFQLDGEPNVPTGITNGMTMLRDLPSGNNQDVMGKVDVSIPAEDVVKGLNKSYSMRLKNDKIDRKLTFAVTDYDIIPEVITPNFTTLTDLVITGYGTSSAKSSTGTFEIEAHRPIGSQIYALASVSKVTFTCTDITPEGSDVFSPRKYKVDYTSSSPRSVTLGDCTVQFEFRYFEYSPAFYKSPVSLSLTIRKS